MSTYFSATGQSDAVAGFDAAFTYISLHTASPGTTGANEVAGGAYARVQTTWTAGVGLQVLINVPAGTTITHFGMWSAGSGGIYGGGGPLAANVTYTDAGTYLLTPTVTAVG
jgi:hypothetical protein